MHELRLPRTPPGFVAVVRIYKLLIKSSLLELERFKSQVVGLHNPDGGITHERYQ